MKNYILIVLVLVGIGTVGALVFKNRKQINMNDYKNNFVTVIPVSHASMELKWYDFVVYTDPVGGADAFKNLDKPEVIVITHDHPDHFNVDTLRAVVGEKTVIVAPKSVSDQLPADLFSKAKVLNNGEGLDKSGLGIEAVAMYNIPEKEDAFHPKGKGNGYVLSKDGQRIYVSGDTSRIPEMKNLGHIDLAFLCMNLPYTMDVNEASEATLDFKPKEIIPYHYRGMNGFSDINKFKQLVNVSNPDIKVTLLDWYKK